MENTLAGVAGKKFILSYSCGKDSTLCLHKMLEAGAEPMALLVMFNPEAGRSYFHGVDPALLEEYGKALELPLLAVLGCLLVSVCTNLGGSYMMRGIINDFIWSGCTDVAGLAQAIVMLVGIYLIGCLATYGQAAIMVRLAQRGVNRLRKDCSTSSRTAPELL